MTILLLYAMMLGQAAYFGTPDNYPIVFDGPIQLMHPGQVRKKATIPKKPVPRECDPEENERLYSMLINPSGEAIRCTADGTWEIDKGRTDRYRQTARKEKSRKDLIWAARTRVLTIDELAKIYNYGPGLMNSSCDGPCSFDSFGNEKLYNELLLQQVRLRIATEKDCGGAR